MSGLYLLALIGVWLLVGWVIYRFWRRWQPQELKRKILHLVAGLLLFSLWFGGAFWEVAGKKMYWDAQVRKLCAIDGGVKVYETVELTPEIYEYYAGRNWVLPDKSDAKPSDEYFFEWDIVYYHRKDPQVTRSLTRVIRRSDGKVLGEYTDYGRGGGDLPGPWHGSSFSCADIVRPPSLATLIFKEGK